MQLQHFLAFSHGSQMSTVIKIISSYPMTSNELKLSKNVLKLSTDFCTANHTQSKEELAWTYLLKSWFNFF